MNAKQFGYKARPYPAQSVRLFNALSTFALSVLHASHHRGHPAH